MPNKPKTTIRGFRVPDSIYEPAKAEAEAAGENLSEVVRMALADYAKKKQRERRG